VVLGRRLTETEFSQAYGLLFQESGSVHDCLLRVRSLDQRSLKQAYRRRAQETHPDRAHLRAVAVADPEGEFRSVVAAYELLKLVQQGAVDVHVIARKAAPAAAQPRSYQATPDATRRYRDAARAANGTREQQRPDAAKPQDRQHYHSASASGSADSRRSSNRDAYRDRAEQRAEAWGRFWQQSETASKFNPWSDHYFEQQIPTRQLPFGQFLYYSGAISWKQLIDALVWQRQQRPMIGQLARKWGILTEQQVQAVLERRRASGRYEVKFADFAEELGFLTAKDKMALCGRMKMLQKPIGQYFVDQGIFSRDQLTDLLSAHRRHNWRSMQRRAKAW